MTNAEPATDLHVVPTKEHSIQETIGGSNLLVELLKCLERGESGSRAKGCCFADTLACPASKLGR